MGNFYFANTVGFFVLLIILLCDILREVLMGIKRLHRIAENPGLGKL